MLERPPVHAPRAVVATAHPLASEAALAILRFGGSAADAAVAAGAVLAVVEPWASHLGGDAFAVAWDASTGRARAIQGSGAVPADLDAEAIVAAGSIPIHGGVPVTVPGAIGAWFRLLQERGRLPVGDVFAPAIRLARDGFPIGGRWERTARLHRGVVDSDPGLRDLVTPAGRAPRAGDWIRQADLADTLEELAKGGAAAFYDGSLGKKVVREIRLRGGAMNLDDLRAHETDEVDPLAIELAAPTGSRGVSLLEQPPVSQGAMVPAILRLLEEADRRGLPIPGSDPRAIARDVHLQVETYRRIRADRDLWLCDPRLAPASFGERLAGWLSGAGAAGDVAAIESALAPVSAAIREAKAAEAREAKARRKKAGRSGAPRSRLPRDTTYLCVVDAQGDAVSWIQSIFHPFGAGWVVPGTGILLNNRMTGFSLDPASPNCLAPRKRTIHTLNPWMVLRDGTPWVIGGTPGAEAQVMVNVQVLRARIARSMPLVEAIRAPRWFLDAADRVHLEARFPREVRRRLERRGHTVVRDGPWDGPGFFQAIERLDGGGWLACTDPRGEGLAIGM